MKPKRWSCLLIVMFMFLSMSVFAVSEQPEETETPAPTASPANNAVGVDSVSFTSGELILKPGGVASLKYTVSPGNAGDKSVTFSSEDDGIAAVDSKGKVTAKSIGFTTITVTSVSNPAATDICVVTVEPVQLTRLNLSVKKLNMGLGASQRLPVTATPAGASVGALQYRSSDSAVCSVDSGGNLSANYPGTAVITVFSGSLSAACEVTVKPTPSLQLGLGKSASLRMVGVTKNVKWSSGNPSVVSVSSTGKVTAADYGVTAVTATNPADNTTQVWTVGVVNHVKKIAVPEKSITLYYKSGGEGQKYTVTPSVIPEDATNLGYSFESSDSDVASVSDNGVITAVSQGRAKITVMSLNGSRKTSVNVVVFPEPSTFELSDNQSVVGLSRRKSLKLNIGSGSSRKGVVWTSSNPAVAVVNKNGSISGTGVGEAVITAEIPGIRSVKAEIEVVIPLKAIKLESRSLVMKNGSSLTLGYLLVPENTSDNKLTWISGNTNVATVDGNGRITAVGYGSARIVAVSESGRRSSCTVRVPRQTHPNSVS